MKKILVLIFAMLSAAAWAGSFQIAKGTADLGEGGTRETVIILTEKNQFSFIPPFRYTSAVKTNLSRIEFLSPAGNIAITVQITTNSPGEMADESELRSRMSALYPGCQVVVASEARFYQSTGRYIDVLRVLPNKSRLMTRHAFLPIEEGTLEVALTCDEPSFRKQRALFGGLLSYFKVEPRQRKLQFQVR